MIQPGKKIPTPTGTGLTMLYQLSDFSVRTADFAEREKGINNADKTTKPRGRTLHQLTLKREISL